jgi:hypothetical protein
MCQQTARRDIDEGKKGGTSAKAGNVPASENGRALADGHGGIAACAVLDGCRTKRICEFVDRAVPGPAPAEIEVATRGLNSQTGYHPPEPQLRLP